MIASTQILVLPWYEARSWAAPLRRAVFVVEQGVPEELEWDDLDVLSTHVVVLHEGQCLGTGRLTPADTGGTAAIGRMAVRREWRKQGTGSLLMQTLLEEARRLKVREIVLHAQIIAKGFYGRFGFVQTSLEFQEAGITHVEMRLSAESILKT